MSNESIESIEQKLQDLAEKQEQIIKLLQGKSYDSPGFVLTTNQRILELESRLDCFNAKLKKFVHGAWGLGSGIVFLVAQKLLEMWG